MIDFSQFKTAVEKLIALFLSVSEPMRQKDIYTILNIGRWHCAKFLEELEKRGFIEKSEEQFGIVLYKWNTGASTSPSPLTVNVNFNKLNSTREKDDLGIAPHSCPLCGNQTADSRPQTAEDASGVKPITHERETAFPVTANVTTGFTESRSPNEKTGQYANRPKFTKLVEMPKNGDFDGLIYAADLNRNTYMSRMIDALGIGESATGHIGDLPFQEERFLLFKQTLTWETFRSICLYKVPKTTKSDPDKWEFNYALAAKFRDEVLHRLAFAQAMNVPELRKFDHWIIEQQQEATKKTPESINRKGGVDVHTILIQKLRKIFIPYEFGWTHDHLIPSESFRYIEYEGHPSAELCPVYFWLQRQKEWKIKEIKKERENQRQVEENQRRAAEEEKRLEPLRNRYKIAEPFHKAFKAYLPSVKETTAWHEYLKRFDNVTENELASVLQKELDRMQEEKRKANIAWITRKAEEEKAEKKKAKVQDSCPAMTRGFAKLGKALKGS